MTYDKMSEYVKSIFSVFLMVNEKADARKERKMKYIAIMIYNYALSLAKEHNVDLNVVKKGDEINLIPFFEYVSYKNIEFYDFSHIKEEDLEISKKEDIERFVLTHVYYLTQS
jgi:hypothetical protein